MTQIDRPTSRIEGVLWSGIWLSFVGIAVAAIFGCLKLMATA